MQHQVQQLEKQQNAARHQVEQQAFFSRLDANKDGVIDRAEFNRYNQRGGDEGATVSPSEGRKSPEGTVTHSLCASLILTE